MRSSTGADGDPAHRFLKNTIGGGEKGKDLFQMGGNWVVMSREAVSAPPVSAPHISEHLLQEGSNLSAGPVFILQMRLRGGLGCSGAKSYLRVREQAARVGEGGRNGGGEKVRRRRRRRRGEKKREVFFC